MRVDMKWAPKGLPENVFVVLSTLPDIGGCLQSLMATYKGKGATFVEVPLLDSTVRISFCTQTYSPVNVGV